MVHLKDFFISQNITLQSKGKSSGLSLYLRTVPLDSQAGIPVLQAKYWDCTNTDKLISVWFGLN